MSLVKDLYEPHVIRARARLKTDAALRRLVDPSISPELLERFFIQWNSLGVFMTEPVEGWIRRAGERCVALGLEKVGRSLVMHARHEAGHHLMMIEDVKHLVEGWNSRRTPRLESSRLLAQMPTDAMRAYRKLHEDVIASAMPAGQVAIEFEIENLSVVLLPSLLGNVERVLGKDFLAKLSFMQEHAEIDVGHTALNEKMLGDLLTLMPENAEALADIGSQALDIYVRFLTECLEAAEDALRASAPTPAEAVAAPRVTAH